MSIDPRRARLQNRTATPTNVPASTQPPTTLSAPATASIVPSTDGTNDVAVQPPAADNVIATEQPPKTATSPPPSTETSSNPANDDSFKLKFCTVCASNNNRSMEAHLRLSTGPNAYPVISFGTGSLVRLPGPSISQPQVYEFNVTSYDKMHDELEAQDARLYRNNGILNMLDRNRKIKWGPERFHDWIAGAARMEPVARNEFGAKGSEGGVVDVIFTCEERCWDSVVDNLLDRGAPLNRPVHVINVDIRDNHEEALVGGRAILELADALNAAAGQERQSQGVQGWENGTGGARLSFAERVPDILGEWQVRWPNLPSQWTLSWL